MCTHGSLLCSVTYWKPKWDISLTLSHHCKDNLNFMKSYLFTLQELFPYAVGFKIQHHITESRLNTYILRKTSVL